MAATPSNNTQRYQIGDLILDTGLRRVTRGDDILSVGGLTFDFLLTLAADAPNLVTYDDFAERVWNGRPTTPETITQRANMLREALDDDATASLTGWMKEALGGKVSAVEAGRRLVGSPAAAMVPATWLPW